MHRPGRINLRACRIIKRTRQYRVIKTGEVLRSGRDDGIKTYLGLQLAGKVGRLYSLENMEIVVRGMTSRVPFRPDGRTEDDQVSTRSSRVGGRGDIIPVSPSRTDPALAVRRQTHSVIEAWMMYMLPIAPPALFQTHSSRFVKSVCTWVFG